MLDKDFKEVMRRLRELPKEKQDFIVEAVGFEDEEDPIEVMATMDRDGLKSAIRNTYKSDLIQIIKIAEEEAEKDKKYAKEEAEKDKKSGQCDLM